MPPLKKITAPAVSAEQSLALFARNLESIRRWYRGATYAGREMGHVVLNELILANVATALSLAMEGKEWVAPMEQP